MRVRITCGNATSSKTGIPAATRAVALVGQIRLSLQRLLQDERKVRCVSGSTASTNSIDSQIDHRNSRRSRAGATAGPQEFTPLQIVKLLPGRTEMRGGTVVV